VEQISLRTMQQQQQQRRGEVKQQGVALGLGLNQQQQ